jgi:hypothetical protein
VVDLYLINRVYGSFRIRVSRQQYTLGPRKIFDPLGQKLNPVIRGIR